MGSTARGFAQLAAVAFASGCTNMVGSNSSSLPHGPPIDTAKQTLAGRLVGPGPVLTSKFGGPIFGWAIDENGTDGVLTEVTRLSDPFTSVVETFDQTKAQIVKTVRKQNSGPNGNRELVVDAIAANDVSLIDDGMRNPRTHLRNDVYYVMAPVSKNKITGKWMRPAGKDFLIQEIADQQLDPDSVMTATILNGTISKPPTFEVVITDIASNEILHILHAPKLDGVNYPYLVAEDTTTRHAYVPAANYQSDTVFVDFNILTGHVSNNFVAPPFSGPVTGIAIDSATHMMCTTTHSSYSVQMYNLTTKKQTFVGQIPNAGGELQAGTSIAADPINHLFLVEQPQSLLGGSEIYVYDEKGNVLESLSGFEFLPYELTPGNGIQVVPSSRSGYVAGPGANHLQSFTY
ncbi:MAG TPA: hypothetical protein VFE35_01425 [Candidatus Cybelea sp.]|jgi:hypothetical protein|nr:hypothetical protein [Candidatus Cybelea sp.]